VPHDELLEALWPKTYVQPEVLKSHTAAIRALLGDDARKPLRRWPSDTVDRTSCARPWSVTLRSTEPSSTLVGIVSLISLLVRLVLAFVGAASTKDPVAFQTTTATRGV
jgi:hypothetical protein